MAYEAYTATVHGIAHKAYAEWKQGNDTQSVIERMAREANVEEWHCNKQLTKLIIDNHYDAILQQAKKTQS